MISAAHSQTIRRLSVWSRNRLRYGANEGMCASFNMTTRVPSKTRRKRSGSIQSWHGLGYSVAQPTETLGTRLMLSATSRLQWDSILP